MSKLKKYKLGEVCDITSSKRIFYSEYVASGIPFYRSKEIIDLHNKRNISTELFISEKRYNEIESAFGVPMPNDILLTSVGSLGIPYQVKQGDKFYFKDGNLTWFRNMDKDILSPDYFMQWICSNIGKQKLDEITIGSTQQALTISGLKSIDILLPPIEEQEQIAGILSSLDDKIDLLNRQNFTLETMAEALFQQYFIENSKEDWELTTLGKYVICTNGVSYKSDDLNGSTTAMATLKSFHRDGGFKLDGYKEYTGGYKPNQTINEGDLLVAHTDITQDAAVIGNPVLVISDPKYDTLIFSMDLVKVEPIDCLSREVLYLLMKSTNFKEHCLGYANGSTVLHLSKKAISEFEFIMPTTDIVEKLQKGVVSLVDKLFANYKQIFTLTQLRDNLLPRLMNNDTIVDG